MDLTAQQMKSWIEELIRKNTILEEENKSLIRQGISAETNRNPGQGHGHDQNPQSEYCVLHDEVKNFKSDILALEQENESLKLKNLELVDKLEILEQKLSNSVVGDGEEENPPPRTQGKIHCDDAASVSSEHDQIPTVIINPLEIEEIVRIILGHVKPADLLQCRQVSKLWKNAAQKHFQENLSFHVNTTEYLCFEVQLFLTHSATSFPMFRNLRVDLESRSSPRDCLKLVTHLFANRGKFLHKLQLNFNESMITNKWTLHDFRDIFMGSLDEIRELKINMLCDFIHEDQMFFPNHVKRILPELTTLNIGLNCRHCSRKNHGNTQVFADLLRLLPHLKTLYWRSWNYGNDEQDGSKNFIESLFLINPIGLENLFIYSAIADDLALSIANSNLKLKQLYFIEFRGFGLHFLSAPTPDGKNCEITPKKATYSGGQTGPALKTNLEKLLAQAGNMSCTNMLLTFASHLTRQLNQGQ